MRISPNTTSEGIANRIPNTLWTTSNEETVLQAKEQLRNFSPQGPEVFQAIMNFITPHKALEATFKMAKQKNITL